MSGARVNKGILHVFRWLARIWSLLILFSAAMMIFTPDPNAVEPVSTGEMIVLGLTGVSVLGLLAAWRWEIPGGAAAVAGVLAHIVGFRVVRGFWALGSAGMLALLLALPGVLFMACGVFDRQRRAVRNQDPASAKGAG